MTDLPIIWSPTRERINNSNLKKYCDYLSKTDGITLAVESDEFYLWSAANAEKFWGSLWDYFEITCSREPDAVVDNIHALPGASWFPGATLNFAENLLRRRDCADAIVFWGEGQLRSSLSYEQLYQQTTSLAANLRALGIKPGDRVAGAVANSPAAIIGMLAATAIGAVWSSCSPDFGVSGIVDRFGQIEPKILIATDAYFFKGKRVSCEEKISAALKQLPSVEQLIVAPYAPGNEKPIEFHSIHRFDRLTDSPPIQFAFEQLPAAHPVYIMFSSGTTGKPKCIVHGAAGTLLEHRKELELHTDLKPGETIFYQTTCGWMMWNWLASALAVGARLVLFDGAPLHEENRILFRLASEEAVSIFGTNAKYLSLLEKSGVKPAEEFSLPHLRSILSTGSVLAPDSFDYVYRDIKTDVQLSSISGGTDILGCFALGSPARPVYRGALQTRSFGLSVAVFDDKGESVRGKSGELVCTSAFPSMPIYFWNDPGGAKYRKAYFERFPGVWTHGDYTELLDTGAMIFYGRSDATLNPGGVRIGTAEIYQQVESIQEVVESVAVALRRETDEQIMLFVVLRAGAELTEDLTSKIKGVIRNNLTAFHVPHHIFAVSELPRTRSGKVVELAIRDALHGKAIENTEALGNPEMLEQFRQIGESLKRKS